MHGDAELIGRDELAGDIVAACSRASLVTVTGPGGVGKSALLEVVTPRVAAEQHLAGRSVQLARIDPDEDLERAILGQLGLRDTDDLHQALSSRPTLLALDNCEHVVERLRPWLASLRSAVAGLHVIATSTTPLAFTDEHLVVVPPLDPPDAIQLLRRVAGRRGTPLDDVGDGELADLVTLVDGLPLGLELAAGCLRTLPLDALLAGLTEPGGLAALDVPAGGGGLEPLLARAVDRLAPAPRDALPQLAFLGGAFTGEIAAAALGRSTVATLPVLQQLVDVSLLMREPHGNTGHFRFLHVVRSHVRDHGDHDLAVAAQARFVQNAAVIATELETALSGPMSLANARRLHQWFPHLLAAARHAIDHDQVEVAAGILPMASWWADTARTGPEVDTLADRLLAHPGFTTHPRRGDLLAARALLHLLGGRADRCRDLAEQALDTPPGAFTPALAHVALGMALLFDGDITAATAHLEACIEQATAAGMPALADYARLQRAMVTARTETFGAAVTACREIVERATREGDVLIGTCASAFESYLLLAIDPEAARATAELAIPVSEEVGDAWTCASLRMSAGVSAALTGDTRGGARWLGDSLRRLLDQGDLPEAQLCVLYASVILDRLGDSRAAQIVASVTSMGEIHDAAFSREEAELLAPALAAVDATTAPALGTPALLALTLAALDDHAGDGQPSGGTDRASLRRAGHAWEVTFDGVTVTLPSRKGLGDLARLLATPDQEIHCLELMGAGAAVGDMGPDIDERAIGAYRDRLHALEEFIEAGVGDTAGAAAERDDLLDELSRNLGLGGRTRRSGSHAQKARSAVTWRIRAAIRLIGEHHAPLGRHLDAAVRTGTWCAYRPERPVTWHVER